MMLIRGFIITSIGQGLLLRLPFADNGVLSGKRTFLAIGEEGEYILLLNVSSTKGKEHKLLFDANEEIINYNPPFKMSSFVKFDALYKVEKCRELTSCILSKEQKLDSEELTRLIGLYEVYSGSNEVKESIATAAELRSYLSRF